LHHDNAQSQTSFFTRECFDQKQDDWHPPYTLHPNTYIMTLIMTYTLIFCFPEWR
jgi:hypothetical protein